MLRVGPLKILGSFEHDLYVEGRRVVLHSLYVRFVDVKEYIRLAEQFETFQSLTLAFFGISCAPVPAMKSAYWEDDLLFHHSIILHFGADPIQSRQRHLRRLSTLLTMRANQMHLAPSFQAELEQVLFH